MLIFMLSFQCLAQKEQEYFNFIDTTFKVNSIKRISYIYFNCTPGRDGSFLTEDSKKNIDSIIEFLSKNKSIVLELGVHYSTVKRDSEHADYFKSLLVHRGIDPSRINSAGYGSKYPIYPKKTMKEVRKKVKKGLKKAENSKEWCEIYEELDEMNNANTRVELKILQQ